jgi:hypothetical protein
LNAGGWPLSRHRWATMGKLLMKKYRLGNHIQAGALIPVLLLTFLCLGIFVISISDLDNLLEGNNNITYSSISVILEVVICIVIFIAIYLLLDNIFSMEINIMERGIEIRSNNFEINTEWAEIDNIYEEAPLIIGKYRYIHLKHKKKFIKGLIGKLFFWLKTENIYYMFFEEEAIQNIESKFKN